MTNRIIARPAMAADTPITHTDPAVVASFMSDAAHVPGGFSAGVAFPKHEGEVAAIVARAARVLPVGAQSSLTGGATPRGDVVVSTRALGGVGVPADGTVRVGTGVPLIELQRVLRTSRLFYPPVPTFEGAFVGGAIATNAAGAATFKYGSTRAWVGAITVVLASGDVLDVTRGHVHASEAGTFEVVSTSGARIDVPVPRYRMPETTKLSAGYYARPRMDLIDLFIGSEGTLGIITAATLAVLPAPDRLMALVTCGSDAQALALTAGLRRAAIEARAGRGALECAAIEYMDARSLEAAGDSAFVRSRVPRPDRGAVLLLVQIETPDADASLVQLQAALSASGIESDPLVAMPGDQAAAERLLGLREAVPAGVNALIAAAQLADGGVEKTAGDMIVPFDRLADALALYRDAFARRGLDHAVWGHVSDGNLHPNAIPRTLHEVEAGREALLEMARAVVAMGGAPLAEHGVGRSAIKQRLLRELYGDEGIEQMRAVKRALDPEWKLSPGVLFEA